MAHRKLTHETAKEKMRKAVKNNPPSTHGGKQNGPGPKNGISGFYLNAPYIVRPK